MKGEKEYLKLLNDNMSKNKYDPLIKLDQQTYDKIYPPIRIDDASQAIPRR